MKGKIRWMVSGLLLVSLSSISVAFAASAAQVKKPIILVANWYGPPVHMRVKNHHVALCNEIEKRTNGSVRFTHHYMDSLCKITEYPEGMKMGLIDVCSPAFSLVAGKCPLAAASMPFAGKGDIHNIAKINRFIMDEVGTMYGFKSIAATFTPFYQIFMRRGKEVKRLDDLKGLNIRGVGGPFGEGVVAAGANNISIATAEVALALERGTIDGVLTYFGTAKTYIDSIASVSIVNYASVDGSLAMSENKWNGLPKDIQNIILKVGLEFDDKMIDLCEKAEMEVKEEFRIAGKKFFELPHGDIARWKELCVPVWEKWAEDKGEKGRRIIEFIKKHS
jgi:TRAP-type C4-dicarboxylate transport system substrate-binding protein